MLEPGEEFAGYRIVRILGRGGMGAVYAAAHPRLPRTVALKPLTLSGTDASAQARFEREAELLVQLDHPGIVNIFDRGVDGEVPWIAMQFVDGEDASTALRRQGVFAPDGCSTWLRRWLRHWTSPTRAACCTATSSRQHPAGPG